MSNHLQKLANILGFDEETVLLKAVVCGLLVPMKLFRTVRY